MIEWSHSQKLMTRWFHDVDIHDDDYVLGIKTALDKWFSDNGRLSGKTMDIGGAFGIHKYWCDGDYTVCDPTYHGPTPEVYLKHYGVLTPIYSVFRKGEDTRQPNCSYDTVLISSALDHCEEPGLVIDEAFRILKPGGRLLVFQRIGEPKPLSFSNRVKRALSNPLRCIRGVFKNKTDKHLHHFSKADVVSMVGGNCLITKTGIECFYAFDVKKECRAV